MLIIISVMLCVLFGGFSIGFGVHEFVHKQLTDSLLPFILGLVSLNVAFSLSLVRIVSPIERRFATLFKALDGFYEDVIEIRDSLRGREAKVAGHDDLLAIRDFLEEMKTEGVDRSDLLEIREDLKKWKARKKV